MKDLEDILKDVEKPGRYIGGEWNEIKKDPHRVKAKVALIFPELYEVGMSYLGQKILYSLLNDNPSILAERVFAPWVDFEQKLRSRNIPLYSLENKIPLEKFDVLGFSLLYELNYTNILTILDLGHIPLFSSHRNKKHPLIIAGGPAVFNPEPVASIFDLFLVGDGEEAFLEIIEKFITLKEELKGKSEILNEMAKIKGVYVPSLYTAYKPQNSFLMAVKPDNGVPKKIEKRIHFPLSDASFPEKIVVPNINIIFDRVAVEVARGCYHKCRFCQALSVYFPHRAKSPSFVLEKALESLQQTGYEAASLSSLSVGDYPYLCGVIETLMSELEKQKISLSLSSLRPKGLSSEIARNIIKVRKTGFTLVPEAGTERLRNVINKDLKDSEILEAAENAFSRGWKLLKLYFMVGLPTERDEDLEGIVSLVEEMIRIGSKILKSPPNINISATSFIPKPHTPFQWLKMEDEKILEQKHRFLKSRLKKYPFIKFKNHSLKNSILEAVFSRGDSQLTQVLFKSWKDGASFESWTDLFDFRIWEKAFESENIDYRLYLEALDRDAVLPWDHIDTGIKKSHLLQELDRALKEERTLSCLDNRCDLCQGCNLSPLLEREFQEKMEISSEPRSYFGKETEDVFRYRATYSKGKTAKFISHLDLGNIIQRTFRRAGISVVHTEGFHPKMAISYLPALPLGMEGKAEIVEFKSQYSYKEDEFVSHVNKFLPAGVKFISLVKFKTFKPRLNEEIKTLVYSVDLKNREIKEALEEICKEKNISSDDDFKKMMKIVDDFLANSEDGNIEGISADRKRKKLFLYLKHSPHKNVRSQDVVENILKIKNPVFMMAREKVLF
ncbi:MAG: TIGR03960 family B12-binding radical SAM protein [Candidatus Aminicenantes bacterium]|nr:TIGR03960 family B12-binding radical SAM protein [Candidatus Aminicenantes bacterium]